MQDIFLLITLGGALASLKIISQQIVNEGSVRNVQNFESQVYFIILVLNNNVFELNMITLTLSKSLT